MSMRYPGGLIATSPVNARYPSGVWTQAQAAPYQAQNVWTRDQFWPYTTLLLQGDGATNGAQNNTFLDSSSNNFTITRNGNTTQGAFTPYEANGYWSAFFAGGASGGYITSSTSADYTFGTGDFTIEGFVFITGTGTGIFQQGTSNFPTSTTNTVALGTNGGTPTWQMYAKNTNTNSTATWASNTWYHFAVVRSGTTTTLYINGSSVITVTGDSTNYTGTNFGIGSIYGTGSTERFTGYLSNLRVVKGAAVYTANFTPPTSPLTAFGSGTTALIALQSNRYIDTSASPKTLTVTGDTSVQAFQPFPGATTWSASVLGGSGYFDGSGDYLTAPNNTALDLSTGDFTVEVWFYPTVGSQSTAIVNRHNGNFTSGNDFQYGINLSSGSLVVRPYQGTTDYTTTVGATQTNAWNHAALVRTGNTFYGFLNGVRGATSQTISGALNNSTWATYLGASLSSTLGNAFFTGYMGGVRITKGGALYTGSTYTVPTVPLTTTVSSGTVSLLTEFTNAGIYDNSMMNNLETVGNAQVSTSVVKYGTGSMAFDGSGDYLVSNPATSNLYAFGTGDFTIEFWINPTTTSGTQIIYEGRPLSTNGAYPTIYLSGTTLVYYANDGDRISGGTISTGVFSHIAVSRSGTSTRMFLNGTQVGSTYTDSTNYLGAAGAPRIWIGAFGSTTIAGYIDDLRITKGYARYTANFTPPPARMPGQ